MLVLLSGTESSKFDNKNHPVEVLISDLHKYLRTANRSQSLRERSWISQGDKGNYVVTFYISVINIMLTQQSHFIYDVDVRISHPERILHERTALPRNYDINCLTMESPDAYTISTMIQYIFFVLSPVQPHFGACSVFAHLCERHTEECEEFDA
jgi:hypothetical protein